MRRARKSLQGQTVPLRYRSRSMVFWYVETVPEAIGAAHGGQKLPSPPGGTLAVCHKQRQRGEHRQSNARHGRVSAGRRRTTQEQSNTAHRVCETDYNR